jgi:hypothetical protein
MLALYGARFVAPGLDTTKPVSLRAAMIVSFSRRFGTSLTCFIRHYALGSTKGKKRWIALQRPLLLVLLAPKAHLQSNLICDYCLLKLRRIHGSQPQSTVHRRVDTSVHNFFNERR